MYLPPPRSTHESSHGKRQSIDIRHDCHTIYHAHILSRNKLTLIAILSVLLSMLTSSLFCSVIVYVGSNQQFVNIQAAVDWAENQDCDVSIKILPGTYYDPIVIDGFNHHSLTLSSVYSGSVILSGDNLNTPLRIQNSDANIRIEGLIVKEGFGVYSVVDQPYEYSTFSSNGHYNYWPGYLNVIQAGGGVFMWNAGSVFIGDCVFSANTGSQGLAIFACNANITVEGCCFIDNSSFNGMQPPFGAAICAYMSNVSLRNSMFSENFNGANVVTWIQLHAREQYQLSISGCTFFENSTNSCVIFAEAYATSVMQLAHNTIANNEIVSGPALMISNPIGVGTQLFNVYINSNIIWGNESMYPFDIYEGTLDMNLHHIYIPSDDDVKVVCRNNVIQSLQTIEPDGIDDYIGHVPFFENNIDADPLFSNTSTGDFSLTWSGSQKSPCINAGYRGANNELTDPDGTPPDIGCVYYPHYNKVYFDRPSLIKWMSFPVIDDRTSTNEQDWNELGYLFQTHMVGAPYNSQLNQIQWSYDTYIPTMIYIGQSWANSNERVIQPKGYKVQLNQGMINSIPVQGFKVDAATTPATWAREAEVNGQLVPFENWIGYYVPFTQKAGDALSRIVPGSERISYLDYIHSIITQNWSTKRMDECTDSPWIIDPNKYTLSEGDMVCLKLLPKAPNEMFWYTEGLHSPPIVKASPSAFVFEEKLDYTPVYIELDPNNLPDEVGVFVDGVCKGATVVDSTLIDVCFYNESAKEDGDLEIMFYYGGKGKKVAKGWKVYNTDTMVFEDSGVKVNEIGRYVYISFNRSEGESPVPLVTQLQPNYPNPFNPSTTISFVLSRETNAHLEVYNIRGQKVLTLHNAPLGIGRHSFVWNGKDQQGRQVSSGIYFSRLSTPDGSFTQKMMLMK